MKNRIVIIIVVFICCIASNGCRKFIAVDAPSTSINGENIYQTDATAISVLTGIYGRIAAQYFTGNAGISFYAGLSSDELRLYSGASSTQQIAYYRNNLASNVAGHETWIGIYPLIYKCNSAIEGISESPSLSEPVQKQLIGEAKFLRAFFYFYLVNLYGDVPLAVTSNYKVNSLLPRSPVASCYQQIINDLKDAKLLLSENFLDGGLLQYSSAAERSRPSKWAAAALLARVYLYTKDWVNAETESNAIINESTKFGLSATNNVFLRAGLGNKEAIWQLQPVGLGFNTLDARLFQIPATGFSSNSNPTYLNPDFINVFEANDSRRSNWIGKYTDTVPNPDVDYYYPNKYKSATQNAPVTEHLMILRVGEQYLIRAEARVMQGKFQQSIDDINSIRLQHGNLTIPLVAPSAQTAVLDIIVHERQVELFTELGHRWLDLKRLGLVDQVMSVACPQKGTTWNSNWQWYPIWLVDLQANQNLVQNAGY